MRGYLASVKINSTLTLSDRGHPSYKMFQGTMEITVSSDTWRRKRLQTRVALKDGTVTNYSLRTPTRFRVRLPESALQHPSLHYLLKLFPPARGPGHVNHLDRRHNRLRRMSLEFCSDIEGLPENPWHITKLQLRNLHCTLTGMQTGTLAWFVLFISYYRVHVSKWGNSVRAVI